MDEQVRRLAEQVHGARDRLTYEANLKADIPCNLAELVRTHTAQLRLSSRLTETNIHAQ
jgi:hypothetical protein